MHHSEAYEFLTSTIKWSCVFALILWAIYFLDAWLEKKAILKGLKWSQEQKEGP